ncbi:MAG: hypothetical protein KAI79_03810, partial [Bacteroidales bacterium]|nr:hypothetical protein [Bacteroidales bacterium]
MHEVPKYYIFRILLLAIIFYFLLILPPFLFVMLKSIPEAYQHIIVQGNEIQKFDEPSFYFHYLIFGFVSYILFNLPIKLHLCKIRKEQKVPDWMISYSKKVLRYTPFINAIILFIPELIGNIMFFHKAKEISITIPEFWQTALQMSLVSLVSAILVSLIVYLWQENRVRLNYLPLIFSKEELEFRYKKVGNKKIATNFLFSGLLTSFLPILIIVFYLILSATPIKKITENSDNELSTEQAEILFGEYYNFYVGVNEAAEEAPQKRKKLITEISQGSKSLVLFYYNASDSLFMIVGIANSILIALFYIILINKLNARVVVVPLIELRDNMKKTAIGEFGIFNVVRTNNEIGSLAESFNSMSNRLKNYFTELTDLNKNLEQKVIDRTAYIEQQ